MVLEAGCADRPLHLLRTLALGEVRESGSGGLESRFRPCGSNLSLRAEPHVNAFPATPGP